MKKKEFKSQKCTTQEQSQKLLDIGTYEEVLCAGILYALKSI